jgi:hypothetical protein
LRAIAFSALSEDYTCFLFCDLRYRIKSTGKERWEVYDLKEGMALNVDYMTKTFGDAYKLLCNHVNNSSNNE